VPNRILREGILTSERVNNLSMMGELFYRRLFSVADDFGRYTANKKLLRTLVWTFRVDDVTEKQIGGWLKECAKVNLVILYEVDGKQFLELKDFNQRTRAQKSKFPPPEDGAALSACHTNDGHRRSSAHGDGDGDGDGDDIYTRPKGRGTSGLPKGWEPNEKHKELCKEYGLNFKAATDFFKNWATNTTKKYKDWDKVFHNAITGWLPKSMSQPRASTTGTGGRKLETWK